MVIHAEVLQNLFIAAGISHDPKAVAEAREAVAQTAAEDLSPLLQLASLRREAGAQSKPVLGIIKFKWFAKSRTASCVLSDGKRKVRCCLARPTRALHGSLVLITQWRVFVENKAMYLDALKWEALSCRQPAVLGLESSLQQAAASPALVADGTVIATQHLADGGISVHLADGNEPPHIQQLHIQPMHPILLSAVAWLHPGVCLKATGLGGSSAAAEQPILQTTGTSQLELGLRRPLSAAMCGAAAPPGCISLQAEVEGVSSLGIQLRGGAGSSLRHVCVLWDVNLPNLPWTVRAGSIVTLYHLLPQRLAGQASPMMHLTWTAMSSLFVHTCGSEAPREHKAQSIEARPLCSPLLTAHNATAVAAEVGCSLPFAAALLNSQAARASLTLQSAVYSSHSAISFLQLACRAAVDGITALPEPLQPRVQHSQAGSALSLSLPNAAGTVAASASDAWLAAVLRIDPETGALLVGPLAWRCAVLVDGPSGRRHLELLRHCAGNPSGVCALIRSPRLHAYCYASDTPAAASVHERAEVVLDAAAQAFSLAGKARTAVFADQALATQRTVVPHDACLPSLGVSCKQEDITLLAKLEATVVSAEPCAVPPNLPPLEAYVQEPLRSNSLRTSVGARSMRHSLLVVLRQSAAGLAAGQALLVHVQGQGASLALARAAAPGTIVVLQPSHVDQACRTVLGCILSVSPAPAGAAVHTSNRPLLQCAVTAAHGPDLAALKRVFSVLCDLKRDREEPGEQDRQLYDLRGLLLAVARDDEAEEQTQGAVPPTSCRLKVVTALGAHVTVYLKNQGGVVLPPLLPGSVLRISCVRRLISASSASVYAATTAASTIQIEATGKSLCDVVAPDALPFASCGALLRGAGKGLSQCAMRLRLSRVRCIWFELESDTGLCTSQWIVVDGTGESIVRCTGAVSWLMCGLQPHRQRFWMSVARQLRHLSPSMSFSNSLMSTDLKQFLLSAQHFMTARAGAAERPLQSLGHSHICSAALHSLQHLDVSMCSEVEESVHLLCLEVVLASIHGVCVPQVFPEHQGQERTANPWVWMHDAPMDQDRSHWTHEVDMIARQTFKGCTTGPGAYGAAELQWRAGRYLGSTREQQLEPPQPSRAAQVTIAPRRSGGSISTSTRAMPRVSLVALAARPLLPQHSLSDSTAYIQQRLPQSHPRTLHSKP